MPTLRPEDAPVGRHQGPGEFTKCLFIPSPHSVRESLDLGLLTPEPKLLQPLNNRIGPARRELGFGEVAKNAIVGSPLRYVTCWEMRRDSRAEVINDFGVAVNKLGRPSRERAVSDEVAEQSRQRRRLFFMSEDGQPTRDRNSIPLDQIVEGLPT